MTTSTPPTVGASARLTFTVAPEDTAAALGSGDLPVLGTPRLLAWAEAATCAVLHSAPGAPGTSVGTRIELEHLKASAIGSTITVCAELTYVDGRLHRFAVSAQDQDSQLVGAGTVTRVVVDRARFLARIGEPSD